MALVEEQWTKYADEIDGTGLNEEDQVLCEDEIRWKYNTWPHDWLKQTRHSTANQAWQYIRELKGDYFRVIIGATKEAEVALTGHMLTVQGQLDLHVLPDHAGQTFLQISTIVARRTHRGHGSLVMKELRTLAGSENIGLILGGGYTEHCKSMGKKLGMKTIGIWDMLAFLPSE
jgi:hypothetical protein